MSSAGSGVRLPGLLPSLSPGVALRGDQWIVGGTSGCPFSEWCHLNFAISENSGTACVFILCDYLKAYLLIHCESHTHVTKCCMEHKVAEMTETSI